MVKDTEIPSLYAIGGTATDDVWVGGERGALGHWDGREWSLKVCVPR